MTRKILFVRHLTRQRRPLLVDPIFFYDFTKFLRSLLPSLAVTNPTFSSQHWYPSFNVRESLLQQQANLALLDAYKNSSESIQILLLACFVCKFLINRISSINLGTIWSLHYSDCSIAKGLKHFCDRLAAFWDLLGLFLAFQKKTSWKS